MRWLKKGAVVWSPQILETYFRADPKVPKGIHTMSCGLRGPDWLNATLMCMIGRVNHLHQAIERPLSLAGA